MARSLKKFLKSIENVVKMSHGFTLIELLLVIALLGIVGATASPLLNHHELFQERFFIDELSNMLRFAHKVATATGCEVQLRYKQENELALYMRQSCTGSEFSQIVASPFLLAENQGYTINVPRTLSVKANFPLFIESDGKVVDQSHLWQKEVKLQLKNNQIVIDGFSGFVYEKSI